MREIQTEHEANIHTGEEDAWNLGGEGMGWSQIPEQMKSIF